MKKIILLSALTLSLFACKKEADLTDAEVCQDFDYQMQGFEKAVTGEVQSCDFNNLLNPSFLCAENHESRVNILINITEINENYGDRDLHCISDSSDISDSTLSYFAFTIEQEIKYCDGGNYSAPSSDCAFWQYEFYNSLSNAQ